MVMEWSARNRAPFGIHRPCTHRRILDTVGKGVIFLLWHNVWVTGVVGGERWVLASVFDLLNEHFGNCTVKRRWVLFELCRMILFGGVVIAYVESGTYLLIVTGFVFLV